MASAGSFCHLFRPFPRFRRENGIPSPKISLPSTAADSAIGVGHRKPQKPPVARSIHSEQRLSKVEKKQEAGGGQEEVDMEEMVQFLCEDLPHIFDDQGIDRTRYDDLLQFRDPVTRYDDIDGYLFYIELLRLLCRPDVQLHHVKQTGPYEITTRWTMVMNFGLLPWKSEVVFTGISIMGINPRTRKIHSHVDIWDSVMNNEYFSLEALVDFIKQVHHSKTPDVETPKYQVLKRAKTYEVRKYAPFLVVEARSDKLSGAADFSDVIEYIHGKNSSSEKIPMTTPVFTQVMDDKLASVFIQIVLPWNKELDELPVPNVPSVSLRKMEGGIAAVAKFSGVASEETVRSKEKALRSELSHEGFKPREGCLLARYDDTVMTLTSTMRNEVLIWLEEFTLE